MLLTLHYALFILVETHDFSFSYRECFCFFSYGLKMTSEGRENSEMDIVEQVVSFEHKSTRHQDSKSCKFRFIITEDAISDFVILCV